MRNRNILSHTNIYTGANHVSSAALVKRIESREIIKYTPGINISRVHNSLGICSQIDFGVDSF